MIRNKYPIESLLRPPIETYSAAAFLIASIIIVLFPKLFLLNPRLAIGVSSFFFLFGLKRRRATLKIMRYQKHLNQLPAYALSSKTMLKRKDALFLGKGFRWEGRHTQRLFDCQLPQNAKYLKQNSLFKKQKEKTSVGGNSQLHGVELKEVDVYLPNRERFGHTLVLGTTRVGKTRFLEVLVTQDIHRNDAVIVFDPKGDAELLRRLYFEAHASGRLDDFIIFHLGFPEISARYNPIGNFAKITEVANRVANQLPGSGDSAAFKEFGWRFVNIIAKTLVALGRIPDYQQIQRYILAMEDLLWEYCCFWLPTIDPDWENEVNFFAKKIKVHELPSHLKGRTLHIISLVRYLERHSLTNEFIDGLCSSFNYDKSYFDKITASLLPLIEKLTTGKTAELISPDYFNLSDTRPIFDWLQVIRTKKIVYVGLDALSDSTVATAVGNSMFNDLCSVAGQIYKYGVDGQGCGSQKTIHPVVIHADEFNEIIGDEFIPLLNKGGGAGFQITAYTQTWSDVEARLGMKAKAGQVGGNFNSLICLRVLEEATARLMTDKLPQKISVCHINPASSVNDSAYLGTHDFSSTNEDRIVVQERPLLSPQALMQLPKGHAFVLKQGDECWKIQIPLPKDAMNEMPFHLHEMVVKMRQKASQYFRKVA